MTAEARRFRGTRDMASCMQVMRVLQSYLDGQTDEVTARRVARHLDACRRCGLEAATYRQIKAALTRRSVPADQSTVERVRRFATGFAHEAPDPTGSDNDQPPSNGLE
jgi:anti-sigma factor RsiW